MIFSVEKENLPEDIFSSIPFSQLSLSCHCKSRFYSYIQPSQWPEFFSSIFALSSLIVHSDFTSIILFFKGQRAKGPKGQRAKGPKALAVI